MRRSLILFSAVGALLLALVMLRYSNTPQPIAGGNHDTQAIPSQPPPASLRDSDNSPRPDASPLWQTDTSWPGQLPTLQAETNELFGASSEARMKALQDFVESISPAELPNVLRELQTLQEQKPTIAGHDLEMRLLKRWAENDPAPAATWAGAIAGDARPEALAAAASIWARKDFSSAAAWAEKLPEGTDRQGAIKSIVSETLYSNPTETLKMVARLPADSERDDLIARAASAWAAAAPADAAAYVKQFPDDNVRKQAIAAIAIAWADKDPIAAGNLAVNSLPTGKLQQDAVFAVLRRWSQRDKPAAEAWVAQFPTGELRTLATETLANDSARLSAAVPTD